MSVKDERYQFEEDEVEEDPEADEDQGNEEDELPFKNGTPTKEPEGDGEDGSTSDDIEELLAKLPEDTIPMKFRRDGVKEGRKAYTINLERDVIHDAQDVMNEMGRIYSDEKVWETDVKAAIFRAGIKNLDAVEEELQNMGYGLSEQDLIGQVMQAATENPEILQALNE